jgi:polysaccharide export outer membrane protein
MGLRAIQSAPGAIKCSLVALLFIGTALANGAAGDEKAGALPLSQPVLLQENDEIAVHSLQVKEIADKTFRLDQNGEVNFPLAGVVKLGGFTPRQAEKVLAEALKSYYREPDIEINVTSFHVETISVMGAVGTPGVYPLRTRMNLTEALSAAGGVRGDAGPTLLLTRQNADGPIPHQGSRQLVSGESVVEIDIHNLMAGQSTADNIPIKPHDVITVGPAQFVYVLGNVKKAGGFALGGRTNLSVTQAVALAEGLDPRAAPNRARILRRGSPAEQLVVVDIRRITQGKAEDVILRPNDILFIPSDAMKTITTRTIEAAIQIGTGIAIFRP